MTWIGVTVTTDRSGEIPISGIADNYASNGDLLKVSPNVVMTEVVDVPVESVQLNLN